MTISIKKKRFLAMKRGQNTHRMAKGQWFFAPEESGYWQVFYYKSARNDWWRAQFSQENVQNGPFFEIPHYSLPDLASLRRCKPPKFGYNASYWLDRVDREPKYKKSARWRYRLKRK